MDFSSAKFGLTGEGCGGRWTARAFVMVKFVTGAGGHTNYLKVGFASVPFHVPKKPASDEDRLSQR